MRHIELFHRRVEETARPGDINVNEVHAEYKSRLGVNGIIASILTSIYGSMWFVYTLAFSVAAWMFTQSWLGNKAFDPYPFVFCLFIGNIIQLLGGPIIQVGQNQAAVHSELRAESDHLINLDLQERLANMEQRLLNIEGMTREMYREQADKRT